MSPYDIDRPGRVLKELLDASCLTPDRLASSTGVPLQNILSVLDGETRVTEELARCLGNRFRTSTSFWLDLQRRADRQVCRAHRGSLDLR